MSIRKKLIICISALCFFSAAALLAGLYIQFSVLPPGGASTQMIFTAFYTGLIVISVLMMVSLCVVGAVLIKGVVDPLNRLYRMAARIKNGDLSLSESYAAKDEFGFVFREFDEMREKLEKSLSDLNAADKNRRDMLQSIAHDIKTPLTAISGAAEMISLSGGENQYTKLIVERCGVVNRMVEDLAEYASLSADAIQLNLETVDAAEYLRETLSGVAGLDASVSAGGKFAVPIDRKRFARVIQNVAQNSVKFGASSLTAHVLRGADSNAVIRLCDDGSGSGDGEYERLFERFYRGDKARAGEGSGLGLSIAKRIVEAHGGAIWAAPNAPRGLTVFVSLPLAERTERW